MIKFNYLIYILKKMNVTIIYTTEINKVTGSLFLFFVGFL